MRPLICLDELSDAEARRVLFHRLCQFMAADDRYVPLSRHGRGLVDELRADILAGRPLAHDARSWRGLFASAHRDGSSTRYDTAFRTGLLGFVGHLRAALRRYGPMTVPLPLALLTLLRCEYEPGCIDTISSPGGPPWRLYLTTYGTAALGVYGFSMPELGVDLPIRASPMELFELHRAASRSTGQRSPHAPRPPRWTNSRARPST